MVSRARRYYVPYAHVSITPTGETKLLDVKTMGELRFRPPRISSTDASCSVNGGLNGEAGTKLGAVDLGAGYILSL